MTAQWTLVDRPKHWNDKGFENAQAVVRNSIRLLEDAALLQTYHRFATACTLATIAFEEAGKVALQYWADSEDVAKIGRNWSYHLRKQAAAGCLLLADVAKQAIDKHPARKDKGTFGRGSETQEAALREEVARLMASSGASRLMELIALHAVERTKHIGFYADEWHMDAGINASEFSETDCAETVEQARTAIRSLRSRDHLVMAMAVYKTGPLQERLISAAKTFGKISGSVNRVPK